MSAESNRPPLSGITVVDFSANAAGPVAGVLLADFGARVIKVEPPGGDATRQWGTNRFGPNGQLTGTFMAMNRNKLGVCLDLKSSEGHEAAGKLIAEADVVLHSFLPRVAKSLGVDSEQLLARHPRLVHCTVSGFDPRGPSRERPAFDMLLQALCGHMSLTGEPDRPSVRIGPSSIDLITGAHAAFGIVLALRERDASGLGQAIEVSLFDSALHLVGNHIADCTGSGKVPEKNGSRFANMAPYAVFQASDREFFLGVSSNDMWRRLCEAIGREELLLDPRFQDNGERLRHREALHGLLEPIFRGQPADDWVQLGMKLGIPVSRVNNIAEIAQLEETAAGGHLHDTGIHGVQIPGVPLHLSRTPGAIRCNAPGLGQHNEAVLGSGSSKA